eukprot:COSAG02_NODE_380_length_23483_cov_8.034382_3_plen_105_part_00
MQPPGTEAQSFRLRMIIRPYALYHGHNVLGGPVTSEYSTLSTLTRYCDKLKVPPPWKKLRAGYNSCYVDVTSEETTSETRKLSFCAFTSTFRQRSHHGGLHRCH